MVDRSNEFYRSASRVPVMKRLNLHGGGGVGEGEVVYFHFRSFAFNFKTDKN